MGKNHAAIRRASRLAHEVKELQLPRTASEFVKKSQSILEFRILSLESELQLLKELSNLDDDKKSSLIFDSLEKDSYGKFYSQALFDGMRTIHGDDCFIADVTLAMDKAAESAPVSLDESELTNLLRSICSMMGCSMDELTNIIVTNVLFTESLDASLHKSPYLTEASKDEAKAHDHDADVDKNHELRRAMKDTRMMALFKVFDRSSEGTVDFKEIVVGLYKIMDDIDEASHAAVSALLLFDENNRRKLTYDEFARLMLNITASAPEHITFDDVADHLTRNATDVSSGVTDEYVLEKFSMAKAAKLLNNLTEDEKFVSLGLVELVKMDRLFAMFDTDHDGAIDAKELAVGLSKFHQSVKVKTTVEESKHVMEHFDNSHSGNLDKQEFASFVVNFATTAAVDLLDMLDFMLVVMALKENAEAEKEYVREVQRNAQVDYSYG